MITNMASRIVGIHIYITTEKIPQYRCISIYTFYLYIYIYFIYLYLCISIQRIRNWYLKIKSQIYFIITYYYYYIPILIFTNKQTPGELPLLKRMCANILLVPPTLAAQIKYENSQKIVYKLCKLLTRLWDVCLIINNDFI